LEELANPPKLPASSAIGVINTEDWPYDSETERKNSSIFFAWSRRVALDSFQSFSKRFF
jgi:hypothetical protein